MLKIEKLDQFYESSHILRDVNLHIKKNQCNCLIGRNGVGKTTLLKCLMGLNNIKAGQIIFEGKDISKSSPAKRAKLGLGYVPQGRQIFPLLTVKENLQVALAASKSKGRYIPTYIYDFFPVLKEMSNRNGGDLSGGQQQQLAIARALVTEPKLLILDEPTEGIQPNIVKDIGVIIKRLNKTMDLTILLVEQKLPFVKFIADEISIMERGHIVHTSNKEELTDDVIKKFLAV